MLSVSEARKHNTCPTCGSAPGEWCAKRYGAGFMVDVHVERRQVTQ